MKGAFNYKYDGLIARAKITELLSKVQCEVAKQEKKCYQDRENMFENGIPTNNLDLEYENLQELYDKIGDLIDNFR